MEDNQHREATIANFESSLWGIGCEITKHDPSSNNQTGLRRFRSVFGTGPNTCAVVWNELQQHFSGPH